MKIEAYTAPTAVLAELGRRLARRRLDAGLTQADAAERAGIGKRTLERIEGGHDTQVGTLLRLLAALDLMDGVERLVPEIGLRPMELLKLKGKQRQRASSRQVAEPHEEWHWGDEG
jgi:transcriptional regulator with XRE-family HTH domain